jgi:hypothetical protein
MQELALACGALRMALVLTVRFEDLRQRHPLDTSGDLSAAAVRALARAGDGVRIVVTAPGKDTTPKSEKEKKWDRYVDEAYDEIFNKKD